MKAKCHKLRNFKAFGRNFKHFVLDGVLTLVTECAKIQLTSLTISGRQLSFTFSDVNVVPQDPHQENMSMQPIPTSTLLLYRKKWGMQGYTYFSCFCSKT